MHHRVTLDTVGNAVTIAVGRCCAIRTRNDKRRNRCRRHQGLLEKHLTLLFLYLSLRKDVPKGDVIP
jgi:hypothetical protein